MRYHIVKLCISVIITISITYYYIYIQLQYNTYLYNNNNMDANSVVLQPSQKHTATVIFLHGLMDTGNGWKTAMQSVQMGGLQHVKFILPTAPVIPVSINLGMKGTAWFDIKSLDLNGVDDQVNLEKNRKDLEVLIEKEKSAGIPSERIVLGGFSQGGALSLYTVYQSPNKLGGCVAMSAFLPSQSVLGRISAHNKEVPLAMFHGTADPVVNFKFGEVSFNALTNVCGVKGKFTPIQGMGHSGNEAELRDVLMFLKTQLPQI
ncbi:hypothetical protein SAMD00019534_009370, partial [Acytostelium subglobosum LB1]|uniref:hypothetical protein n=1 Tax=Acytostelium subglobosum LB1 TaxID=1410327 RepID=UPI000644C15F